LTTASNNSCRPAGIAAPLGLALTKYCLKLVLFEDKDISPMVDANDYRLYFALLLQCWATKSFADDFPSI